MYQTSQGGQIYVPLEDNARIIHDATPKFARNVSSKYARMSTNQVRKDLFENHGRKISQDYIQKVSDAVGHQVELGERRWNYHISQEILEETATVAIGRDGTTTHIREEGYRETMSGTISFHNKAGKRLLTIYKAQAPEYGKSTFDERFTQQIMEVKTELGINKKVNYIGLADGSSDNWTFLEKHTEVSILDYWHACEYLTLASKTACKSVYQQKQWLIDARKTLKEEDNGVIELLTQMNQFTKKKKQSKVAKEGLDKAMTYFKNHYYQMEYSTYLNYNYPIGSGVTEAACKVIVKQRLSNSGMKWNIHTAQNVLNIRAVMYSDGQWEQFWNNVDSYGFQAN